VQDYGVSDRVSWTPAAVDAYTVQVFARNAGSTAWYEKTTALVYHVVAAAPVTAVALRADKPSPQLAGTPVSFTATATGGGADGVEYQFWLYAQTGKGYRLVKDYPVSGGVWAPGPGEMAGPDFYSVLVYARSRGSATPYEKSTALAYYLVAEPPVAALTLRADKASPQLAGTPVIFTATAAGGGVGEVEYQFWLATKTGVAYRLVKDYPASGGVWTAGAGEMASPDCYTVLVYARTRGSAMPYEKAAALTYYIVAEPPVASLALRADPGSPQPAGTPVTFTATATGGGAGGVEYQFWLSSVTNRVNRLVRSYAASNGTWTPGTGEMDGADCYTVLVEARNRGSVLPYERTARLQHCVDAGP